LFKIYIMILRLRLLCFYINKVILLVVLTIILIFLDNNSLKANSEQFGKTSSETSSNYKDSIRLSKLYDLSYSYRTINPDTAISLLKQVVDKAKTINSLYYYYNGSLLLGATYKDIGNLPEAIKSVLELLKYCEKNGTINQQIKCLTDLAEHCRAAQQFDAGIRYITKAVSLSKSANNLRKLAISYYRFAAIYFEYPNFELSEKFADSSIIVCEEIGFNRLIPNNHDILGAIYTNQKEYAKAIPLYYNAIRKNEENGGEQEKNINIYINLARTYYKIGEHDSGLVFAHKAFEFAKINKNYIYKENSAYLLADLYIEIDNYKNAYYMLETACTIRDSLFNASKNQQISEMNTKYETEKKEQQIQSQKLVIRSKEIYNYFLFVSVVFLIAIFIGILFFVNKIRKKNNLLKSNQNEIESQRDNLQFLANELEKSNNIKDRFFTIIAHDLKSPFNSILGLSEILKNSIDDFDKDEIIQISKAINNSSSTAFDLLVNLLKWSQTQTNRIKHNPSKIEINEIIQSSIELLENIAISKSLNISFDPQENVLVYADINMLNSILRNLISNAIKFTDSGRIKIQVNINSKYCEISVQDSGVGIPEDNLKKLFLLDEDISTKGTQGESGTGLGLILCKEFVEKNNGSIQVESTLNEGSKFSFTVPLAQ